MTENERINYNKMLCVLRRISKDYITLKQLSDNQCGLTYIEALEMAYENIKADAKWACHRVPKKR